ncbi:hypothetical protein [Lewinella sp. W8]|uniref:hypothetical protein n=1 Tax=Lewinella sp. W8 TaxID=2528208 RepID=UPI0010684C16|nr:hypothetical protein [Lewinella sp. W8]MTB53197.1 hypothetical protein [Lewinella sp. W8]
MLAMIPRLLALSLGLLFGVSARSQPDIVDFYVDPVGKIYYLRTDDRLVTDNLLGQNEFDFYDSSLGAPEVVDVTNPFSILLFYPDYGEVVVLDRTLSERSRLDLFSLPDILQPTLLARSADNLIWVFDSWDYKLKLIDETGRPRQESNDLRLEIDLRMPPDHLYVDRDRVVLHFREDQRLAVFTNYGRFTGWVSLPEVEDWRWQAPVLFGQRGTEAWAWTSGQRQVEARTLSPAMRNLRFLRAAKGEAWGLDPATQRVKRTTLPK